MTYARLRAILRRRLQENLPDNWTDSDLGELINEAYVWVQLQYAQVNPEGLVHIDYTTLEAGKYLYPWRRGFVSVKEMGYIDTSNPLGYRDMGPARDYWVLRKSTTTLTEPAWAVFGRHFAIFPVPTETIQDAIQAIWMGTLTLANDNDVPELPFNHMSIIVKAQMMCYGETGEDSKGLTTELQDYLAGMNSIPNNSQSGNDSLVITGLSHSLDSRALLTPGTDIR